MTTIKTEVKGRYSLTRIFLACCTFGLSLPFAGVRKRTTTTVRTVG